MIDTGQRPSDAVLKALAEECGLLVIPAVPATMGRDGLRQMIKALAEMRFDDYRVRITKAPPPPKAKSIDLPTALERPGTPAFEVSIPLLKAFEKAAVAGVIVSAADEAYVSTGKELGEYGHSH